MDSGKRRPGCLMGPDAYRTAGLARALADLGHSVTDRGNVAPAAIHPRPAPQAARAGRNRRLDQSLAAASEAAMDDGMPIFMGGDHALASGTVLGALRHAAVAGRPLFVLWLDAHSDFHTPETTDSGNLHGTPLGYVTGRAGFDAFPDLPDHLPDDNICHHRPAVRRCRRTCGLAGDRHPARRHARDRRDRHRHAAERLS